MKLNYTLRNVNLVNIVLAAAVIFFADYMVLPFFDMGIRVTTPTAGRVAPGNTASAEKPAEEKAPSPADYMIIADQNLFHPERKIPAPKAAAAPLPKPDFILYGILMSGDVNIAYMEDKKSPQTTPGRGKRQIPLRVGESLSGFTLKEINKESVVMQRGEDKIVVMLEDPRHPKEREASAQAAPAAGTTPQQQQASAGPAAQQRRPSAEPVVTLQQLPSAKPVAPSSQPPRQSQALPQTGNSGFLPPPSQQSAPASGATAPRRGFWGGSHTY